MTTQNMTSPEFIGFPKISRLSRECIVTEKIDGTCSHIHITEDGQFLIGSRNRWITPEDDNFGFARWATEHKEELLSLGPGSHFGEWWGAGIQRRYYQKQKWWSLFNTQRWCLHGQQPGLISGQKYQEVLPPCCGLVPVLYRGIFSTEECNRALENLAQYGSMAAPGFMQPEGIVVYHIAGNVAFKKTILKDSEPKSA